jgi:DNA-binding PadR family transcriptional regulator
VAIVWQTFHYYAARSTVGGPLATTAASTNDPAILILTSLSSGPKHGYALTQDIEEFAGVRLGPGTLYGAITRLEERGLIEPLEAQDRRRPYRITAAGAASLENALSTMRRIVEAGSSRATRRSKARLAHGGSA